MSANIFFVSDTHFDHANSMSWLGWDGKIQRPFASVEEMNEVMVERWNAVVRPQDKVYHAGDFAIKRAAIAAFAPRLNGHKRLVRGNHDIYDLKFYAPFFENIYGVRVFDDLVVSHIPLHPESVKQRWLGNVHGHTHNNQHPLFFGPRYLNVSVEARNFTPISLEEVRSIFRARMEQYGRGDSAASGNASIANPSVGALQDGE